MPLQLLLRYFTVAIISYGTFALLVFLLQRHFIYPGRHIQVNSLPPAGIVPIQITTALGNSEAWFMSPYKRKKGEQRPLVIFFHGNGEVIDYLPEQAEGFRELGLGVLLVEYPGYGRATGKPSEKSITGTAVAAYDAVLKREEIDPERIIIFGRSLGGGAACALAARRPSAALILQSTFTSTRPFLRNFLVPGFIARDPFDNDKIVSGYKRPILLLHGSSDTIVPVGHSRNLKQLAPGARLIEFSCGHNDLPPDWREYYRLIAVFLQDAGIVQKE